MWVVDEEPHIKSYEPWSKFLRGLYRGSIIWVIQGDTGSLDDGSYHHLHWTAREAAEGQSDTCQAPDAGPQDHRPYRGDGLGFRV